MGFLARRQRRCANSQRTDLPPVPPAAPFEIIPRLSSPEEQVGGDVWERAAAMTHEHFAGDEGITSEEQE